MLYPAELRDLKFFWATHLQPSQLEIGMLCSAELHELSLIKKAEQLVLSGLLSGWQDSNLRPPAPKAGAITGLRYTPNCVFDFEFDCKCSAFYYLTKLF